MSDYKLVIFDFDGTLADTFKIFAEHYPIIAERHGLKQFGHDDVSALRTMRTQDILRAINLPLWKLPRVTIDFWHAMTASIADIRPFAGVTDSLACLHQSGIRLALATSNSEQVVRQALGAEVCGYFERVVCGASLFGKARKIARIVQSLKIPPAQTLYIGDETRDAKAAEEACIDFGPVAWGYTHIDTLLSARPPIFFMHPGELKNIAG